MADPISDGQIEETIKANQTGTPDPSKTSGIGLQDLIKDLRDYFEEKITELATEPDPGLQQVTESGANTNIAIVVENSLTADSFILADSLPEVSGTQDLVIRKSDGGLARISTDVFAKTSVLESYQLFSEKGQADGYAGLDSAGKILISQLPDTILGNLKYGGTYNGSIISASDAFSELNGEDLPETGYSGVYFITTTAFTRASTDYAVGDWVVHNGGNNYVKVDNSDSVSSVFGRLGNISAVSGDYNTDQVTELSGAVNLWYTNARVQAFGDSRYVQIGALPDPISLAPIGSTPNANGATLTEGVFNLQPASASFGGVVTTAAQTFAGDKIFTGKVNVGSPSGSTGSLNTNQDGIYSYRNSDPTRFIRFNANGTFNDFLSAGAKLVINFGFSPDPTDVSFFEGSTAVRGGHVQIGTSQTDARLVVSGRTSASNDYAFKVKNSGDADLFSVRNDGQTTVASLSSGGIITSTSGVLGITTSGASLTDVVHKTGFETIGGVKTFNSGNNLTTFIGGDSTQIILANDSEPEKYIKIGYSYGYGGYFTSFSGYTFRTNHPASSVDALVISTTGATTFATSASVPDEIYGAGWNGSLQVPTKNAIYDKIESLAGDYTPIGRTLTINGSGQTLAANRSWTITTNGTTNRISVSGGSGLNPTVDISSSYVGQASITTLGTIGTGIWQGTAIADTYIASQAVWHAKQAQLNGTGFVKASGTTITYDNSTYYLASNPAGYITGFTETDPIYTASSWYSTANNASNWNTAYGWGNHASVGYVTASSTNTFTNKSGNISQWTNNVGYITGYTETDTFDTVLGRGNTAFNKNLGIENGQVFITKAASNDLSTGSRLQLNDAVSATRGAAFHLGNDGDTQFQTFRAGTWATIFTITNNGGAATFASTVTATNFIISSDRNFKNISSERFDLSDLKGTAYYWKDGRDSRLHYGYIAQEVHEYMPGAVYTDIGGNLAVSYTDVLVAKVQQLEERVKELEGRL